MKKNYLCCSLLITIIITSQETVLAQDKQEKQEKQIVSLKKRLSECNLNNRQLTEENQSLHESNKRFMNWVIGLRDSVNYQIEENKKQVNSYNNLQGNYKDLQNTLNSTNNTLTTTQKTVEILKYDLELQQDAEVMRVYEVAPTKAKESFISRLSEESLGFQFDEDELAKTVKITKAFDGNTEAWWVFDKTIDVLLEMKMQFVQHKYDPNKTILYVNTILLEKVRYSNKQYQPQDDADKAKLYQEKAVRLLETNIRRQTKK